MPNKLRAAVTSLIETELALVLVAGLERKPTEEERIENLNSKTGPEYTDYFWGDKPLIRVHKFMVTGDAADLRIDRLWIKEA